MSLRDLLPDIRHPHTRKAEILEKKQTLPGFAILFEGRDARTTAIRETVERVINASRYHDRLRSESVADNVRIRLHLLSQAADSLRTSSRLIVIDDRPSGYDGHVPLYCGPGGHLLLPLDQVEAQLIPLLAEFLPY